MNRWELLPALPLRQIIESCLVLQRIESLHDLATSSGVSRRVIQRVMCAEQPNIHYVTADRLCTALGIHPSLVFDEWGRCA